MASHSSVLAWRIPGTVEPGGLQSMGLHRVRHDWSNLAAEQQHAHKNTNINKNHIPFLLLSFVSLIGISLYTEHKRVEETFFSFLQLSPRCGNHCKKDRRWVSSLCSTLQGAPGSWFDSQMLLPHPTQHLQLLCLTNGYRQETNCTKNPAHTLPCLILTFKGFCVLSEMLILQGETQAGLSFELPGPVEMVSNEALNFFS